MTAYDEILRVLGARRKQLAHEVHDALDTGGYLIDPAAPFSIVLDPRAVERVTVVAGVELGWNGGTLVGITIRDGIEGCGAQ